MADGTKIEWANTTWNPLAGCSRVSPGCGDFEGGGCYAERQAMRLAHTEAYAGTVEQTADGPRWTGRINLLDDRLDQPLRWCKPASRPRRIFVNSMSDLFHPGVPDEFIVAVYARMALASKHVFQVLTKRPQRMARLLSSAEFLTKWFDARHDRARQPDVQRLFDTGAVSSVVRWPIPNVWNGTSIESQDFAFRCRHVIGPWNAVPWVSAEPLLGSLDLSEWLGDLRWVVAGGESGPGSRPMHPDWPRQLRDDCNTAGVAFLFKQWGNHVTVDENGPLGWASTRVPKKTAGRTLDGCTWDEYPAWDQVAAP
jgi:protein gp37